jgi:site-specific DNA-methyltransferase (adenine-specific)
MAQCEYLWTNIDGNSKIYSYMAKPDKYRFHPCQKPIELYKWLLYTYAKQGDRILDTHLGSGTLAVACNDMGFDLIAAEIDEDYYEKACQRIRAATAQGQFDFGGIT